MGWQNLQKPSRRSLHVQERPFGPLRFVQPFQPQPAVGVPQVQSVASCGEASSACKLLREMRCAEESVLFPSKWTMLRLAGKTLLQVLWSATGGETTRDEASSQPELLQQMRWAVLFTPQWQVLQLAGKTLLPVVWEQATCDPTASESELLFEMRRFGETVLLSSKWKVLRLAGKTILPILQCSPGSKLLFQMCSLRQAVLLSSKWQVL